MKDYKKIIAGYSGKPFDFGAYQAKAKTMSNEQLEFALKDISDTLKLQKGMTSPKHEGWYYDELSVYQQELKSRGIVNTAMKSNKNYKKIIMAKTKIKISSSSVIINGKPVDTKSISLAGIDTRDYPDFSDAFVQEAAFEDGTLLNEEELNQLMDLYPEFIHEKIEDFLH